jgi:hypothetical protein
MGHRDFNKGSFAPGTGASKKTQTVVVQPRSSSTRTVWATGAAKAKVLVSVTGAGFSSQLLLNADRTARS